LAALKQNHAFVDFLYRRMTLIGQVESAPPFLLLVFSRKFWFVGLSYTSYSTVLKFFFVFSVINSRER
jgi:hypothetical protein